MFYRLLGILDLVVVGIILLASHLPHQFIFLGAMYLLLKGGFFAFMGDIASFIDAFIGIYMIVLSFGLSITVISVIAAIFLLQKAALSIIFG